MEESWTAEAKRFKAVVVEPTGPKDDKLLFSQSFNGFRTIGPEGYDLHILGLAINSILAVHYFLLTDAHGQLPADTVAGRHTRIFVTRFL